MRILSAFSLVLCLATFCACGGGGIAGTGATGGSTAHVAGKVTIVDGSSADLGGIVLETLGNAGAVVTGSDGSFRLAVRAGERIVLRFEDPDRQEQPGEDEPRDIPEDDDLTPDGTDIDGNEVEIEPLDEDEDCDIEIELENGEVVACRVDRPDREKDGDERPRFQAECRLKRTEDGSEPEAVAEAELECSGDCCVLEVEVGRVQFATELTVAIECEEEIETIGKIAIVEGGGHFELDSCAVDALPFGVESIYGLRGCTLLLLDEAGAVALFGCVPGEREEERRDRFVEDCALEPVDGSSEPEARGGSVLRCAEGSCELVVEVGGVTSAAALTVVVECGDSRVELGTLEIVEGQGRFARTYGREDARPFDVESLRNLGECRLLLLDEAGDVALAGCFPGKRSEEREGEEPKDGDGEGEGAR